MIQKNLGVSAPTGRPPAGLWDKARAQISGGPLLGPRCSGVACLWLGSQPTGERGRQGDQGCAISRKKAGRQVRLTVLTLSLGTLQEGEKPRHTAQCEGRIPGTACSRPAVRGLQHTRMPGVERSR